MLEKKNVWLKSIRFKFQERANKNVNQNLRQILKNKAKLKIAIYA